LPLLKSTALGRSPDHLMARVGDQPAAKDAWNHIEERWTEKEEAVGQGDDAGGWVILDSQGTLAARYYFAFLVVSDNETTIREWPSFFEPDATVAIGHLRAGDPEGMSFVHRTPWLSGFCRGVVAFCLHQNFGTLVARCGAASIQESTAFSACRCTRSWMLPARASRPPRT
jgi:hypothetical protein